MTRREPSQGTLGVTDGTGEVDAVGVDAGEVDRLGVAVAPRVGDSDGTDDVAVVVGVTARVGPGDEAGAGVPVVDAGAGRTQK